MLRAETRRIEFLRTTGGGLRLTDVPAAANLLRLRRELRNIQMEFLLYSNANPILRFCY
jgi:hypothetical protein